MVLVDEYDKPILDSMYEAHAEKNHSLMRDLYSPLKEMDHYLKFIFLTGITKISHVNIFSGLNQLSDISMVEKYDCICGITEEELKDNFAEQINDMSEKYNISFEDSLLKLKYYYDGYHFSTKMKDVYNPFSLIKAFSDNSFGQYWFESGTPTILKND